MKHLLLLIMTVFSLSGLSACGPTYPKESLTRSVESIVRKEYKLDSSARLVGETLYLDVVLPGMVSTEKEALADVLEKVQGAALAITRVSLSSDAKIGYLVLVVRDPSYRMHLRIIQRLEDIKGYLYQKISRSDYEERLILEIEGNNFDAPGSVPPAPETEALGMREFLGRLIVSQINMLSRNNPFLAVVLGNSQLVFERFAGDELVVRISNRISQPALPLLESIVGDQTDKIIRKFKPWQLKRITIIGQDNQTLSIDVAR